MTTKLSSNHHNAVKKKAYQVYNKHKLILIVIFDYENHWVSPQGHSVNQQINIYTHTHTHASGEMPLCHKGPQMWESGEWQFLAEHRTPQVRQSFSNGMQWSSCWWFQKFPALAGMVEQACMQWRNLL